MIRLGQVNQLGQIRSGEIGQVRSVRSGEASRLGQVTSGQVDQVISDQGCSDQLRSCWSGQVGV